MRIKELRENEPLEVIEVYNHIEYAPFRDPKPTSDIIEDEPNIISEYKRIKMEIYTDGEIVNESKETTKNIKEYYIGKRRYHYDVDTLKTKNVYLKNHSYVITLLIASEPMTCGRVHGWFDFVRDFSVYLNDRKDKSALKEAKHVLRAIEYFNISADYSSLFEMSFPKNNNFEKPKSDTHILKKTKQNK